MTDSALSDDIAAMPKSPLLRDGPPAGAARKGPVTLARQKRALIAYLAIVALGAAPWLVGAAAPWQAAGAGLWLPGGGFLVVGGWGSLLFPLTIVLFVVALIAWFWAGMLVAPAGVWLGSAMLAFAMAGENSWSPGAPLAALATVLVFAGLRRRTNRLRREGWAKAEKRRIFLPASLEEVRSMAAMPVPEERELSAEDLAAVRYLLDRALQPVDQFGGFTMIDQFQPAALRYQINYLGYALAILQTAYVPAFSGYVAEAQRNLIEKYLVKRVWDYWVLESCWGNLNFTNWDPADKDNIMLTAWFALQVGGYMLSTGDRRYMEPGSLTFRLNGRKAWPHSFQTLMDSVRRNYDRAPFFHYPCEPNWIYPICNAYGMSSLVVDDALNRSGNRERYLRRWLEALDTEFTDESGSIIGLRSQHTGLPAPFPSSEAGFALFFNVFAPERAQTLWATARKEIEPAVQPGRNGHDRLVFPTGIDFGNYRKGNAGAYASVLLTAREFGDETIARAAQNALDEECGLSTDGGVRCYLGGSNRSNIFAAKGRIVRTGDFARTFSMGPAEQTLRSPILSDARYPDVLVARAFSNGEDLELVLHPGSVTGIHQIGLSRLTAGRSYRVSGAVETDIMAGSDGCARLKVDLRGRTVVAVVPM